MGRETETTAYRIDISHQEMTRIMGELEAVYESTPAEWLAVEGVALMIQRDLGYEDMEEFEDALKGSFAEFLGCLPHINVRTNAMGKPEFRVVPPPPITERKPIRLTYRVSNSKQLFRVCVKSPDAKVSIPELEFEMSADGTRVVDTLYNHIAAAVWNLSSHVRMGGATADQSGAFEEVVDSLNEALDAETPWTWVVEDPSGLSEIHPADDVEREELEGPAHAPYVEAEARRVAERDAIPLNLP